MTLIGITAFSEENGKKILTPEQRQKLLDLLGKDGETFVTEFEAYLKDGDGGSGGSGTGSPGGSGAAEGAAGTQGQDGETVDTLKVALKKAQEDLVKVTAEKATTAEELTKANNKVTTLQSSINVLSGKSEADPPPAGAGGKPADKTLNPMDDQHLFGIQQPFMAIDIKHPYNKRAYSALMARRGTIIPYATESSMDYAALESDLGDYYRVRKQEQIQSFIATLPNIEKFFPLESGYQDQAVLVNLFMGEFSQPENPGSDFNNLVKGTYEFQAEVLSMFDVQFVHKFTEMKKLEKQWIGYLNKEGSSAMKWSFIEFILAETAKKLHNEREQRRVKGVRKNPVKNVPGTAMEGSNGFLKYLKLKIANFQIRPFPAGEWTVSSISNYVYECTQLIPEVWRDTGLINLYMSTSAVTDYHKNNEQLYGGNTDYKADLMYVKEYPNVTIKGLPNMGASKRMFWTLEGNMKTYEDQPGEMLMVDLEQEDWGLKVWSKWKEGMACNLVGKKYASLAEMPDDYSTQLIWCNDVDEPSTYYIPMQKDDTTPSVAEHTSLVSVANTAATAITDIDDAIVGQEIRLKCGNITNAVTIAKSGKFSLLTAAWAPDLNDVLAIKKRSDGKFIEVFRNNATSDAIVIAADDTSPDVADGDTFVTSANTVGSPVVEVKITTLDNAIYNRVYTIYGGSDINSSQIENAGNFVLTDDITLSTGVYIKLQKMADDLIYEISRG